MDASLGYTRLWERGVNASQKWSHIPTISIFERLKKGDPEFEASMDSTVSKKMGGGDDKRKQTNKIGKAI